MLYHLVTSLIENEFEEKVPCLFLICPSSADHHFLKEIWKPIWIR